MNISIRRDNMTEMAKQGLNKITEQSLVSMGIMFSSIGVVFYMAFSYAESKTAITSEVKSLSINDARQDILIETHRKEMMEYVKNQTVLFTEIRDRLTRLEATKNK